MDGEVGFHRRLPELERVDVHDDLVRVPREVLPGVADLANVQPAAEDEQDVRVLHGEVARAIADGSGTSGEQRVVARDDVVRVESSGDGNLKSLGEANEVVGHAREA